MKFFYSCLAAFVLVATACSTTNINVPALDEVDEGGRLPGKIIWHELLSDTPEESQKFYNGLFGWEFEPIADKRLNYVLIRHEGKLIGGMIDQTRLPTDADISQWVSLLAVTDIAAATRSITDSGGTVFTPPTSLGDRGDIAVVADPQGALFALLQTRDGDPADTQTLPLPGQFLWNELWTNDVQSATGFYSQLAPFEVEQRMLGDAEQGVSYQVLSTHKKVRAGIRANPFGDLKPIWVNYLRVADANALDEILARVESLGGHILVPAIERQGGGMVAMIAGPSGAGIALQTWADGRIPGDTKEAQQ